LTTGYKPMPMHSFTAYLNRVAQQPLSLCESMYNLRLMHFSISCCLKLLSTTSPMPLLISL